MTANDLSASALSILEYLQSCGEPCRTTQLIEALNLKRTTLRNTLQRMELFGLVMMDEPQPKRAEYTLTREGQQLIQVYLKSIKVKTEIGKTDHTLRTNVEVHAQIAEQVKQQPNIVAWLRTMAEAFLKMADDLA